MRIIFLFFLTIMFFSYSTEYWYPVGLINQENGMKRFFIHQVSSDNIELWSFNSVTKEMQKELPSHFNPAGFRLLPNKSGFSFVDNGIIRVKYFNKRSPKSLEINEPVYDINVINWKDDDTCYFHAKYQDHYGIFQLTQQGQLNCIIKSNSADYLYPQVVGNVLFYIERSNNAYCILAMPYPTISIFSKSKIIQQLLEDDLLLIEYGDKHKQIKIFDFDEQPIAYLYMNSTKEGFVLAHARDITENESTLQCTYYLLKKHKNKWVCSKFFSFKVPRELLFDEQQRLYEGIIPLLLHSD